MFRLGWGSQPLTKPAKQACLTMLANATGTLRSWRGPMPSGQRFSFAGGHAMLCITLWHTSAFSPTDGAAALHPSPHALVSPLYLVAPSQHEATWPPSQALFPAPHPVIRQCITLALVQGLARAHQQSAPATLPNPTKGVLQASACDQGGANALPLAT